MAEMMHKRAEIEKEYAKQLGKWTEKFQGWTEKLERQYKQTTVFDALARSLKGTTKLAEHHSQMREDLETVLQAELKAYRALKSKEASKMKSDSKAAFKKLRKPWESKKKEVESKAAKHAKTQTTKTKEKLANALRTLRDYKPTFVNEATLEFDKLQTFEKKQSEFLKKTLQSYDKATNIAEIWGAESEAMSRAIDKISPEQDLLMFGQFYGTQQELIMPDDSGEWPEEEADSASVRRSATMDRTRPAAGRAGPTINIAHGGVGGSHGATGSGGGGGGIVALFDYTTEKADELMLTEGETITVVEAAVDEGWLMVENVQGKRGVVPASYVGPGQHSSA